MRNYCIITAAGAGTRLPGAVPKQFRLIGQKPLLVWTIEQFERTPCIDAIHLIVGSDYLAYAKEAIVDRYGLTKVTKIVQGGPSRFDSILCGLRSVPETANLVFIHDGVRPFVTPQEIERVGKEAQTFDAAILAVNQRETLKRVESGFIIATLDRDKIYIAQTPQAFKYEAIISAYIQALEQKRTFTDDAAVCEAYGISVRVVEGSSANIKITTPDDLELAKKLLID
jgi:2-C-methyl-D-erythritol 4-phosphate cytidylyltransferase